MPSAIKISDELVASARRESGVSARSMTQQIEYWARIGRALERSPSVTMARVHKALRADLDYDALTPDERAVALGGLEASVFDPAGDAVLGRELEAAGRTYTALDERGRLVEVSPPPERDRSRNASPRKRVAARRVRRR